MSSTERAILTILWRDGPRSIAQVMQQHPAAYMTIRTTMDVLLPKGFVTRQRDVWPHTFTAVPKAVLLHAAFERQLAELDATAADRAQIVEELRHGDLERQEAVEQAQGGCVLVVGALALVSIIVLGERTDELSWQHRRNKQSLFA